LNANRAAATRLALIGLVLVAWALLAHGRGGSLPSPGQVGAALSRGIADGTVPRAVGASLLRMFVGYGAAAVLGLMLGLALAKWLWLEQSFGALALSLQTLPSICWLPLTLLWFGASEGAVLVIVVLGALFSIATATRDALRSVPPLLIQAGQTLGAAPRALYFEVILPAALPALIGGLRVGWSFAWRALMAGELIYSGAGLGRVLDQGRKSGDSAQILATILVILAVGIAANAVLFNPLESAVRRRWGLTGPQ